jgi:hypothetical protein
VLAAMDGFAVVAEDSPPQLTLVFTDYPEACGAALGMKGSAMEQRRKPTALPGSALLSVTLLLDETGGTTTTVAALQYPRAATGDAVDVMYFEADANCAPTEMVPQGSPQGKSITITAIDASHVAGTVDFMAPGTATPFSAQFDVPMCPLSKTPQPTCCVQ